MMKKWLYLVLTLLMALLEISLFPALNIKAPALVLLLAILAGLRDGPHLGLLVGVVGGLALDISLGFSIPQMAIIYGLSGFIAGYISGQIFDMGGITYILVTAIATVFSTLLAAFFSLAFGYLGWRIVLNLPQIGRSLLMNSLFAILIYLSLDRFMPIED
jgi:rod shape-determining protein MreD